MTLHVRHIVQKVMKTVVMTKHVFLEITEKLVNSAHQLQRETFTLPCLRQDKLRLNILVILGKKIVTKTHQLQDCLFSLKEERSHLVNSPLQGRGRFANYCSDTSILNLTRKEFPHLLTPTFSLRSVVFLLSSQYIVNIKFTYFVSCCLAAMHRRRTFVGIRIPRNTKYSILTSFSACSWGNNE